MKKNALYLLALGLFLLGTTGFGAATEIAKITASGGSPIPTAYSASNSQSLVLSNMPRSINSISIINGTTEVLAINTDGGSSDAPANDNLYVPASGSIVYDKFPVGKNIYIRSDGAAAVTGIVRVVAWGRGD